MDGTNWLDQIVDTDTIHFPYRIYVESVGPLELRVLLKGELS